MANNAHIRDQVPGAVQPTPGADAARVMDDPALKKAFETVRESIITQIERTPVDGNPETERELCRYLRNLGSVRRVLKMAVQGEVLRAADFRPIAPPKPDKEKTA